MALTTHSAKVEEAKKAADKKIALAKVNKEKEAEEATKEVPRYDKAHLVAIASAILAADKTTLQNIPAAIFKAKQVLDEINK